MKKESKKRIDMYDIGEGLTLINVIEKNDSGKMRHITTYIGIEGNGFVCVGNANDLDAPGAIFSYQSYVRINVETINSDEDVYTLEDNEEPTSEEISSVIEKEQIIADLESNTPQNFLEQERIAAYTAFYNEIIEERRRTIDLDEKISKEYIEFVLAANETFDEYDENANYDIKKVIIDEASEQRFGAKEECRQVSNEQILANWYALCGKNSFEEEYVNEEFVYFNYAIDMYLDAYAVSLVKSEIPKITALDYTSTCFLNIYNNVQLSDDIRMEALYSAASFDKMYKEMLSEYDENPNRMNQKEHGVCMDLGVLPVFDDMIESFLWKQRRIFL